MGNMNVMQRPVIVYWSWVFLVFFVAYLISFFIGRRPPPIG